MSANQAPAGVKIYGTGSVGGKGAGLVRVNDCVLPRVVPLPTHILATEFYDRFLESGGSFGEGERAVAEGILRELDEVPIGVRSSATNEGAVPAGGGAWAVHAGENLSFMLPNNHPDFPVRVHQLQLAIRHIFAHFAAKQTGDGTERMAIVINPIPGLFDDTQAGPCFYPYISGVANSFFPYALRTQDPAEGYARIAFGHGYATVLDDFPVISMATIRNPIPLKLLRRGGAQQYFYALDVTRNADLGGDELETMKRLHVRFANFHKIRLLGVKNQVVTIEELVEKDQFGFRSGLDAIVREIRARIGLHFQIEFVFNLDFRRKPYQDGAFHVVQLTLLPPVTQDAVETPPEGGRTYLSIGSLQGHGVRRGIRYAVVVSPRRYSKDQHDAVREALSGVNRRMRASGERYLAIVPGRLGSKNRDWGIAVEYRDVDQAAAIFEYGVDIAGRAEPVPEEESLTGGIYGSHFLYMVLGGYSEDQKRLQARIYGTQGTHFFTNIMTTNTVYGYISPAEDRIDPWFFSAPATGDPLAVLAFPSAATVYADSINQRCAVVADE